VSGFDPVVWVAQGFGSGRLKPAPGTWGSVVGLLWFAGLVATGSLWAFFGGILLSIPPCVWLCGLAEKALGEQDPGSVVLDEIIAVPLCFAAWVVSQVHVTGQMPEVSYFFSGNNWLGVGAIFAAFRLFDIWKPWPVKQSQALSGGWGVTVDDLLAALYVNLVSLLVLG
jgi:phosphatidylglycerophosphatase A